MDGESNGFLPGERIFCMQKREMLLSIYHQGSGNLKIE
jgi:hypothetical protein